MPPLDLIHNLRKNEEYIKYLTLSALHVRLDKKSLVDALKQNQSLMGVKIHAKYLDYATSQQLKELLGAIGNLPKIKELFVALPSNRTHLSSLVIECAKQTLEQTGSLEKLIVSGFDDSGSVSLADILENESMNCLKEVQLLSGASSSSKARGPLAIARSLRQNQTIEKLVFSCSSLCDVEVQEFADALIVNKKLQRLDLRCSTTSREENKRVNYAPLLSVLVNQQNESLVELETDADRETQTKIFFYTRLNDSGAPQFLRNENASDSEWLDLVVSGKCNTPGRPHQQQRRRQDEKDDNISVLFYTLRKDPSYLLSYSAERDKQANERPKFSRSESNSCLKQPASARKPLSLNMKMRRKPIKAPSCMHLNVPM
jgi:hypothetical protein